MCEVLWFCGAVALVAKISQERYRTNGILDHAEAIQAEASAMIRQLKAQKK